MPNWLKSCNWPRLSGYALFVGMMAAGYYYNLTFVQLGLEDFATRLLGLSAGAFARDMAFLAVLTCLTALAFGYWMQKRGWGRYFRTKLRLSFVVVLAQTLLILAAPLVHSEIVFLGWLAFASLALFWGLPPLILARRRGLESAITFHWIQDAARFLAGF